VERTCSGRKRRAGRARRKPRSAAAEIIGRKRLEDAGGSNGNGIERVHDFIGLISAPTRAQVVAAALRGPHPRPNRKIGRPEGCRRPGTVSARWSAAKRAGLLSRRRAGSRRDEGTVGGIPFKEDPNAPCPRSGGPLEGPPERAITIGKKETFRRGGIAWKNADARSIERIRRLRLNGRSCSCRYAVGENEAVGSLL